MSGIRRAVASEKGLSAHGSWAEAERHGAPRTPLEPRARRRSRLPMSRGCNLRCCLRSFGERTSLRRVQAPGTRRPRHSLRSFGERTSLRLDGPQDVVRATGLRSFGERTSLRHAVQRGAGRHPLRLRSFGERTSLRHRDRERVRGRGDGSPLLWRADFVEACVRHGCPSGL